MERTEELKAFVSWSGGKDAALSCWRALKEGYRITHLLNMIDEDGHHSRSHHLRAEILRLQGEAMGVPVVQVPSSWETYEERFKSALADLKQTGVKAGVFGDIDLEEHRQWVERVSKESGVDALLPLWGESTREDLLEGLIAAGFEAVIVAVRRDLVGPEWLGRRIDQDFIQDIKGLNGVDICGEGGEYHTVILSAPFFKGRISIEETETLFHEDNAFLEITRCSLAGGEEAPTGRTVQRAG